MKSVRLAVAAVLVLGLAFAARGDNKDKGDRKGDSIKDKLVGTWELEKGQGVPLGARMQFTRDGKFISTGKRGDKQVKNEGTWKIDGDTLKLTTKRGGKEQTIENSITKVDDKQLVLTVRDNSFTFKRIGTTTTKEKQKK
jgi:uncharacterized protein (TIGR03066 family)